MKKINVLFFIASFISLSGFSQNIRLQIKEKISGEPIAMCNSFIIDPVDNMVVGFDVSSIDGECNFNLIRPLKSDKFYLKLCDMHLVDSIVELKHGYLWYYTIEWVVPQSIKWLTVYYNKKGIVAYSYELDPYSCSQKYIQTYYDSLAASIEREQRQLDLNYQKEYAHFLKEMAWVDSASKANPQLSYILPPPPEKVELPVFEMYTSVSEQGEPPGGIQNYLDHIYNLNILKPEWGKKRNMTFAFRLYGFEFKSDSLTVLDDKQMVMKKSAKMMKAMLPIMETKWKPMKWNGRPVRFRQDVNYTILFIYKE